MLMTYEFYVLIIAVNYIDGQKLNLVENLHIYFPYIFKTKNIHILLIYLKNYKISKKNIFLGCWKLQALRTFDKNQR